MFSLNKQSRLVTVAAENTLAELKKDLAEEGLYLGYYPLDDPSHTINHYLMRRIANLYHYKYGSISDLVSSLLVELPDGRPFHLKDAPRAATGPDFNRLVIGAKGQLGQLKMATFRVVSLPAKVLYGIILLNSREEARATIRHMVGHFMAPLFFKYLDRLEATTLLLTLGEEKENKREPREALLFCLSGLQEIVSIEEDEISTYCQNQKRELSWVAGKPGRDIVNKHIHSNESYRDIKDQYRQFLWPASDSHSQTLLEKQFFNREINRVG